MTLFSSLTRPRVPRAAFLFDAAEVAAAEIGRGGASFSLAAGARTPLGAGLLTPSFDTTNIPDPVQLAAIVDETAQAAGLGKRQRWSVLLPEVAVKSLIVSIDTVPASRNELREMVDWKVERLVGVGASELRIARQFVEAGRSPRFLVVAARKDVLDEYESLFATLDWRVGLAVPRYVGETAWLDWDSSAGDKLVIGARGATCLAAFVRGGELLLVRTIDGAPDRLADEIYRLALFFRDRIAEVPEMATISRVFACGPVDADRAAAAVADALGASPEVLHPVPSLLETGTQAEVGPGLLAAAGLATQAWAR
jgi:Tfp pilus assembly PilM family ATPase